MLQVFSPFCYPTLQVLVKLSKIILSRFTLVVTCTQSLCHCIETTRQLPDLIPTLNRHTVMQAPCSNILCTMTECL